MKKVLRIECLKYYINIYQKFILDIKNMIFVLRKV